MRSGLVVVADELVEDALEVVPAKDEHPVHALPAGGPHESFGVRVGPGGAHRGLDDPGALGAEHGVEGIHERRVTIADQELEAPPFSSRDMTRLRACWVVHGPSGWAVTPARKTWRRSSSMKNRTYSRCRRTVSTVKRSHASTPAPWDLRNSTQMRQRLPLLAAFAGPSRDLAVSLLARCSLRSRAGGLRCPALRVTAFAPLPCPSPLSPGGLLGDDDEWEIVGTYRSRPCPLRVCSDRAQARG